MKDYSSKIKLINLYNILSHYTTCLLFKKYYLSKSFRKISFLLSYFYLKEFSFITDVAPYLFLTIFSNSFFKRAQTYCIQTRARYSLIDIVRYVRVSRKLHVKRHSVDVSISSSSTNVYNTCHAISLSSCFSSGHTYIHREQKMAWRCAFTSWMV